MLAPAETVLIGARRVGPGEPCLVVAEIGVNHNGDPALASRLVDAAADAGADAVKLQTFRAEEVVSVTAAKAAYQLRTTDAAESQLDMLRRLELDWESHVRLKRQAEARGLLFLSTPFDRESVELLLRLDVKAFKVSSPDLTNFLLLDLVGSCGRPVMLSTGLATLDEVERGIRRVTAAGADDIVLLHCTSEYPAALDEVNLRAIATLASRFRRPVGYSDHTDDIEAAAAAVALGACVLEKHFTLDRALPGPDHAASIEPHQFAMLVERIRRVESALGDGVKAPSPSEVRNAGLVRRSLAAARDLPRGTRIESTMLTALRPETGIATARLDDVVGRRLARPVAMHVLLVPDDLE